MSKRSRQRHQQRRSHLSPPDRQERNRNLVRDSWMVVKIVAGLIAIVVLGEGLFLVVIYAQKKPEEVLVLPIVFVLLPLFALVILAIAVAGWWSARRRLRRGADS